MSLNDLAEYVLNYTERGECNCGKCVDRGDKPDPLGHTVDMVFLKVALRGDEPRFVIAERLRELSACQGEFEDCDPFDGMPHSYIELGAWLGSQSMALLYMALGVLVGSFRLISLNTMIPGADHAMAISAAEGGMLFIQVTGAPLPKAMPV